MSLLPDLIARHVIAAAIAALGPPTVLLPPRSWRHPRWQEVVHALA